MRIVSLFVLFNGLIFGLCGGLDDGNGRGNGNLRDKSLSTGPSAPTMPSENEPFEEQEVMEEEPEPELEPEPVAEGQPEENEEDEEEEEGRPGLPKAPEVPEIPTQDFEESEAPVTEIEDSEPVDHAEAAPEIPEQKVETQNIHELLGELQTYDIKPVNIRKITSSATYDNYFSRPTPSDADTGLASSRMIASMNEAARARLQAEVKAKLEKERKAKSERIKGLLRAYAPDEPEPEPEPEPEDFVSDLELGLDFSSIGCPLQGAEREAHALRIADDIYYAPVGTSVHKALYGGTDEVEEEVEEEVAEVTPLSAEPIVKEKKPQLPRVSANFAFRCDLVSEFFNLEKQMGSGMTHYFVGPKEGYRWYRASFGESNLWRAKFKSEKCLYARITFSGDNDIPDVIRLYLVMDRELVLHVFKYVDGQWKVEQKEHMDGLQFDEIDTTTDYIEDPEYQDEEPELDDLLLNKGRDYPIIEQHLTENIVEDDGTHTISRVTSDDRDNLIASFLSSD